LTGGEVTLKLNRRQSDNAPIWAFEIKGQVSCSAHSLRILAEEQSTHGNAMTISHEVKIHILTPKRQQELNEPLCPPPDVSLLLTADGKAGLMVDPHPFT
jgi:HUS1 checkpoint protein